MKLFLSLYVLCVYALAANAATEKTLKFNEAVQEIVKRNEDLKIQELQVESSDISKTQKYASFLPSLALSASERKDSDSTTILNTQFSGVTSKWNLFRFGADLAAFDAADSKLKSSQQALISQEIKTEFDAIDAVLTYTREKMQYDLYVKLHAIKKEYLDVAQSRFSKGILSQQEVDKVLIDFSNSEALLNNQAVAFEKARQHLINLLGHDRVEALWPWQDRLAKIKVSDKEINPETLPAWKSKKLDVETAEFLEKQAQRQILPSLDLDASIGDTKINDVTTHGWSTTLTLSIPLFNQLSDYSTYRLQKQARLQSEYEFAKLSRDLVESYRNAAKNFQVTRDSSLSREKALEVAKKLYQDNLLRFKTGRASVNDVLVDQDRLFQTEVLAVQGWYYTHINFAQLCHTQGFLIQRCL